MKQRRQLVVRVVEHDQWPSPGEDLAAVSVSKRMEMVFEVSARACAAAGHDGER